MEDLYPKAYREVIEILKYIPRESLDKIPRDTVKTFIANMDKNYNFKIDETKRFEEQELLEETKAILAVIFRDYWATPYQREKIVAYEKYEKQKEEEEKSLKYNPDNMFKKVVKNENNENNELEEIKHEEIKKENISMIANSKNDKWYNKIIRIIKNFFKRK